MAGKVLRLEIEAARALAEWKFLLASKISEHATKLVSEAGLASEVDKDDVITLAHYREAAVMALKEMIVDLQSAELSDGSQQAAA